MTNTVETFTFSDLRRALTNQFQKISSRPLFYVSIDRDEIWEQYLSGFPEQFRQEHNCNSCKSFLRQFAGIVAIVDNKVVSIWDDLEVSSEYRGAIDNVKNYIHSRPVTDIFLSPFKKCGTKENVDREKNILWQHFFLEVPTAVFVAKADEITRRQAQARDDKNVLKRGLAELTIDATEVVLDAISQDSIYRGKEYEGVLQAFLKLQKKFNDTPTDFRDNFCWTTALEAGSGLCRIRNTAIGTLLIDLSEGVDLDTAVTKFEKVVAPQNYKRPTALVTPKMVEQAKEKLAELGLVESLERRFASETDLDVSDILFTDRPSAVTDVFEEMAKETVVNPRTFSKVEEISIKDFLANVVPNAKSISILLENGHLPNFVSILTAKDISAPTLFKWDNHFSWNYTGAITDSIKERVKEAGGNVQGELRTSLSWFNHDDLDIHVIEPDKNKIYYGRKLSTSSGHLDVDMNAGGGTTRTPVENIIWTDKNRMREGLYKVFVQNFCQRETQDVGFVVQIECGGQTFDFEFKTNPRHHETMAIVEFEYSKTNGITFKGETKSNVVSKEKWGLKTNQFHKVTKAFLSPNHWGREVGNKHYFFMLEGCIADESPRPFFNEFLKPELEAHRKVFEILGSKVKVESTDNQLSGLGFSETKRASMIVKVTGKFTRTLKVNF